MLKFKISTQTGFILTAGFALFAMFFGSGNLVFPLSIGVDMQDKFPIASIGLLITGILVPFLGLFSVIYCYDGKDYFKVLGPFFSTLLILAMLSLLGPFGASARCILVAIGGIKLILPNANPNLLNALLCGCVYLLLNLSSIIEIIGKILTPWLLLCIAAVIIFGLCSTSPILTTQATNWQALAVGLQQGYQTMDLLAAFFFATTTLRYLKDKLDETHENRLIILTAKASCIGASLLTIIYFGFIALGAKYATILKTVAPEQRLVTIAGETLGTFAMPVVSILICLACITTICILTELFANFISQKLCANKLNRQTSLFFTLTCTYFVSLHNFTDLANWIAKALYLMYPALIVFAIARIIFQKYKNSSIIINAAFWLTTTTCAVIEYI